MRHKETVWTPILGIGGALSGIALDVTFAYECLGIITSPELVRTCREYVWSITKPANTTRTHVPSNILFFDKGTMLVTMMQHYQDAGKWLTPETYFWPPENDQPTVVYSFHHTGRSDDESYNRWLQFVFSRWVQFMQIQLEMQKRAGST